MSRQETIFQTPVVVFEALQGTTEELGNGMCALVGQSGVPPRYKIVCFNDKRQSLCTATLTGSNEHSLQFQLQSAEYACFKSDEGTPYSILFLKSADVDLFVAHLATAFYGASGQPSHSTVIADLAHTTKRDRGPGNEVLDLGKRGKVRYTCFTLNRGATTADLPTLNEKPIDATSDTTYLFEAVQSAYSLPADGKGFESSAVGMITDTTRLVVVPQAMPRNSAPSEHTLVFVLYLKRVVNDPTSDIAGAVASARAVALVNNSADRARNALVLSGGGDDDGPQRPKTRDPNAPGAGIPAEHMLLLQKIAGQLNSVLSSTRDMHDKIDAFSGEWKQTVNRPKPSVLTNTALEQNLRNLINENERARDELTRRDELITSLDERIRELRKRVDKLAVVAQELMDEKKRMVANASTSRLEMDRQILRLQEQINQATNERDDVHRHLTTVKKLLDMSDEQLRDTKGRFEVISVQVRGTADKLDASEEQLGEERTRRKALEAKVAAMQEEIRNALAEARLKSAELDDVNRKADADRIFHAQVMEDERQRRSIDVAQLRSEIVTELQNREAKFQADRARTASDNFERGREEGMDIGKRNARIDNEHRMQELQLEAQRCRTELDAYKTQLRDTQDDALAENRRLEAAVAALKRSTEEATKQKARNEFSVHSLQLRVKHAEDALLLGLSALVNKLSRTIDPTDLLDALDDLHNGRPVDLSFELARAGEEEGQTRRRREDAIFDEAVKVHAEIAAQTFKDWYDPCTAAFAELNADIARLWYERDMRNLDEVLTGETSCRAGIETESDSSFVEIGIRWRREAAERDDIVQEEAHARPAIVTEFDHFVDWLSGLLVEQSASRQNICMACDADYDSIVGEENSDFTTMRNAFERVVFEKLIAEQEVIMGEEEQLRIAVADEENREFDSVRGEAALEQSSIRDMLAERERALRTQRADLEGLESQGRVVVEMDEEGEFESAQSEFKLTMPKPPTPPPPPREPTPPPRDPTPPPPQPPQPTVAPATQQQQPQKAPPPMPPAGKAAAKAPAGKPGTKSKGPMKVTLTDSEADTPRGEPTPRPKPAPKRSVLDSDDEASAPAAAPPHKLSTTKRLSNPLGDSVGVAASDSGDSDNEPGIAVRKAPMAKPANKAASPPGNRGALFDEDSDSEKAPAPTFKPVTKPAAKPTAKTTSLFDGDSDEGTPRPSAKPAAKPAPKRVVAAASDSD